MNLRIFKVLYLKKIEPFITTYCFHLAATLGIFVAAFFYVKELSLPASILFIVISVVLLLGHYFASSSLASFKVSFSFLFFIVQFFAIALLFFGVFKLGYIDKKAVQKSIFVPYKGILIGRVFDIVGFEKKKYTVKVQVERIIDKRTNATKRRQPIDVKNKNVICELLTPFKLNSVKIGDTIQFSGNMLLTKFIKHEGYQNYLVQKNVLAKVFVYKQAAVIKLTNSINKKSLGDRIGEKYSILRRILTQRVEDKIRLYVDYPAFSLSYALVTGERKFLSPHIKNMFRRAGVAHILAVSGMHAAIVMFICVWILRSFWFSFKHSSAISLFAIFPFYLVLTGMRISILRAYSLLVIGYLIFFKMENRVPPLVVLCLCFLFFVSIQPNVIYQISFQLSFIAVFGIFIALRLMRRYNINHPILQVLSISIGAEFFTTPLSIFYFGHTNLLSILYNLFVPAAISFSMTLSLILLLNPFSQVSVWIGDTITVFNHLLFHVVDKLNVLSMFAYLEVPRTFLGLRTLFGFSVMHIAILFLIAWYSHGTKKKKMLSKST